MTTPKTLRPTDITLFQSDIHSTLPRPLVVGDFVIYQGPGQRSLYRILALDGSEAWTMDSEGSHVTMRLKDIEPAPC